jgi:SAM-dependent methyltransferase
MIKQQWNAENYQTNACYVPDLGKTILEWLKPEKDELILDLGCGDGALTVELVRGGSQVVGLEPDKSLAQASRQRGLNILEIDAHNLQESNRFDAIFSNAAMHWMHDPQLVIDNVYHALKNKGRFIVEQGGFGNVAAICTAVISALHHYDIDLPIFPWDFPTMELQKERLIKAGFDVIKIESFSRPTILPQGITGWLETFGNPFMKNCSEEMRQKIIKFSISALEPSLSTPNGQWIADYVRLRFWAVKNS